MKGSSTERCVLVIGYRPAIADWLNAQSIPFAIWHDKPIRQQRKIAGCFRVVTEVPICRQVQDLKFRIVELFGDLENRFTHVIAGTESAVVAASIARRLLKCRLSPTAISIRCHNKLQMKRYLRERGFPIVPFVAHGDIADLDEIIAKLGMPVVVKKQDTSGGRGMKIARSRAELGEFFKRGTILEQFIDAPEMSVESLVDRSKIVFESTTRYQVKRLVNVVPAAVDPPQLDQVLKLNREIIHSMKIRWGMTHAEFYLANDRIYFGEIALRPPGGYLMDLIDLSQGTDIWQSLMQIELELPFQVQRNRDHHAAAVLFHPGAGRVESLETGTVLANLPELRRLVFHVKPGGILGEREGAGDVAAFALLASPDRQRLMKAIDQVREEVQVHVAPQPAEIALERSG
jgi:predicted ATP-grasp superfamily ATP-dependent carboligase